MQLQNQNIVLIGMPGVGKSTVGVILAKRLGMNFIDTDIHIQQQTGKTLHNLIAEQGLKAFCELETALVAKLNLQNHIIATGGSVVYGDLAMQNLKQNSLVLWLDLPLVKLAQRLGDLDARGVVMEPGQTLEQLYAYRQPFYQKYADVKIDTDDLNIDKTVTQIADSLSRQKLFST